MKRGGAITLDMLPPAMRAQAIAQAKTLEPRGSKPPEPKPRMNKTETAYGEFLEGERLAGRLTWWRFEAAKVVIATGTKRAWFTPDFAVIRPDGRIEFHETKGWWRESARLRIKVAAGLYPWARFVGVKRAGGAWDYEEFEP
jgi:hypothetical protein